MAGRPRKTRRLAVWMNGILVGYWTHSPTGESFNYAESWLRDPQSRPLSLALPLELGTGGVSGEPVEAYFDNLLPDTKQIRRRLASRFGARSAGAFDLLAEIGHDCVGAVQLLPDDAAAPEVYRIEATPAAEADIERLLDSAIVGETFGGLDRDDELRISIAGAQEKSALLWHDGRWCIPQGATPTTHILKLPIGEVGAVRADFSTSVENEWLCGQILQAYGLPVAESRVEVFGRHKVLVVARFDRAWRDGWWARLPQEDFCQVYGVPVDHKYEEKGGPGIDTILGTLRGSAQAESDRHTFLLAQLLFWVLAAPDGHAKNFSIFLERGGGFRLTPLYDVMSAWPVIGTGERKFPLQKLKLAMAVRSKNAHYRLEEILPRHWIATARRNGLGHWLPQAMEEVAARTESVITLVEARLPPGFPASVAEPVFDGMRRQARKLVSGAA